MNPTQELSLRDAFRNLKGHSASTWSEVAAAFDGDVWPQVKPSFRLAASDVIFTMGSCFVRNIEGHLAKLGCRTPMLDFDLPAHEWHGRPVIALNKFAPPAFRQAMAWTAAIHDRDGKVSWSDCEPIAFNCGEAGYYDFDMSPTVPVARDRFLERRQQIYDIFQTVFDAQCLIMTPGLIEAWLDTETGLYLQGAPNNRRVIAAGDRFRFQVLDYEQCLGELVAALDIVRARNPQVKVLVTTSPVPLTATFTGQDIVIANMQSKSVLRAACGALSGMRAEVDYFPSYESVVLSHPSGVWKPDRLHVTGGFIGKIVERMLGLYVEGAEERAAESLRAIAASRGGDWTRASAAARRVLDLDPDNVDAAITLIDGLVAMRQNSEAESRLAAMCALYPSRADLHRRHAHAIASQGRDRLDAAADAAIRACTALDSTESEFALADRLLRRLRARLSEREQVARLGVERAPRSAAACGRLADILCETDREDEALDLLLACADLPERSFRDLLRLASLLADRGRLAEAQRFARMAATLAPEEPEAAQLLERLAAAGVLDDAGNAQPAV